MLRGRNRRDANTPRLNVTAQSPGSIQRESAANRAITSVSSPPATTLGRNWSTTTAVSCLWSDDSDRHDRTAISTPTMPTLTAAAEHQVRRYTETERKPSGSSTTCTAAATTATPAVAAVDSAR